MVTKKIDKMLDESVLTGCDYSLEANYDPIGFSWELTVSYSLCGMTALLTVSYAPLSNEDSTKATLTMKYRGGTRIRDRRIKAHDHDVVPHEHMVATATRIVCYLRMSYQHA